MATGTNGAYKVLLDVRKGLVSKIAASKVDENVLISKAQDKDKGLVQSVQATATLTLGPQSKKEKVEQLVTQVLEAVRTDETKIVVFLHLLEESSLGSIATYLRGKLQESGHKHGEETASPGDFRPYNQPGPSSGSAYGNQPKLEPASTGDSAFVEVSTSVSLTNDTDGSQQHQMAAATSFRPLSAGVVVVEQDHTDNLEIESEESPAVPETQPHSEVPPSRTTVLPEVKRMEQENKELQTRLAKKIAKEESLKKELEKVQSEKEESTRKLAETRRELKKKDTQIRELQERMKNLQSELEDEKLHNAAEKEKYEGEITALKDQLQHQEAEYNKERLSLTKEIHALEIKVEQMNTREEQKKREIAEERHKCAKLEVKIAEEKQKNAEMCAEKSKASEQNSLKEIEDLKKKVERIELAHRNSIDENEELKKQLSSLQNGTNAGTPMEM